jgi:hypothetical protein
MSSSTPTGLKSQTDRVWECVLLLAQLRADPHICISEQNPSLMLLKRRMATYWRDGRLMEDRIPIQGTNRSFIYRFPRKADQYVEITLKADVLTHRELPANLQAELMADPVAIP